MPDTDSITLVKEMSYRGESEEFSNTYHLDGTTPSNETEWRALAQAVWETEAGCFAATAKLVRAYGYVAGNNISVAQIDFRVDLPDITTGQLDSTGGRKMAGDQAGTFRARGYIGANGKRVYATKYMHHGYVNTADPDTITSFTADAYLAHAAAMIAGTLPGGMKWVCPQAQELDQPHASPWVTTRTLKRRGRRPS